MSIDSVLVAGWRTALESTPEISSTGGMTFLYLTTSLQANHTLEDMKVAVLKAGLVNQEYRKKQEMRLIFNYGTVGPSGLTHT